MDTSDTIDITPVPNSLFHLSERNAQAADVIRGVANGHALTELGIGFVGGSLPIPGVGIAAMVTSLMIQAPLFYQPMVSRLANIYAAPADALMGNLVPQEARASILGSLAMEFGASFIRKTVVNILKERNINLAVGFLPIVGGIASAAIDATFTTTLTWRVGKMAVIYFQNGGWINSQEQTYDRAMTMTPWSLMQENNLDEIPTRNPEVQAKQNAWLRAHIQKIRQHLPESNNDQIRKMLQGQGISPQMLDAALS